MCLITCQSHTIMHGRIQWKPCNHKIHYTQLCKVSHGYIERLHTTKITSSGNHTWPKLHINKDILNGRWSPEKITLQQIITYLTKSLHILGLYSSIAHYAAYYRVYSLPLPIIWELVLQGNWLAPHNFDETS